MAIVEKVIKGLVIDKYIYGDEHILKILTEKGRLISLKAKGLSNLNSKNNLSLNPFNICEFEYFTSENGFNGRLKTARATKEFLGEGYLVINVLQLLRNIVRGMSGENKIIYDSIITILDSLENNFFNFQKIYAILIIALRVEGYNAVINKCVFCGGKQQIKYFSLYEGGLICANHKISDRYKAKPTLLRKIIKINNFNDPFKCPDLDFSPEEIMMVKSMYSLFFENQLGINLFLLNKI